MVINTIQFCIANDLTAPSSMEENVDAMKHEKKKTFRKVKY